MSVQDGTRFDFIVVDGGTAGNIVACRLTESPHSRTLIEAGTGSSKGSEEIRTPGLAMDIRDSQYDWAYKITMVKRDDYERIEKPNTRGKALGGSSSLNYFSWVPGSKDTRAPVICGNDTSVTYCDDAGLYPLELKKIGAGGLIPISHAELILEMKGFRDRLAKAWKSTGQPISENFFYGEMHSLVHSVNTIYKARRSGSVLEVVDKPNITIPPEAHSKRLIIDNAGRTAKGVTVITGSGQELNLYATREGIVSQGVFETNKLLILSGIGPASELAKHNIPVVVDSRHVGQHLLDHPGVPFVFRLKDDFPMDDHGHHGPMSSPFLGMIGFPRINKYPENSPEELKAKAANCGLDSFFPYGQPRFELSFIPLIGSAFQRHFPHPNRGSYMTVMVDLVRPVFKGGEVTLNSMDSLEKPNIKLNYLNDGPDTIAIRKGIRFAYDVLKNGEGFKDIVVDEYPWDMPLHDDQAMKRTVLYRSQTSFHHCGTARLSMSIHSGVVDAGLKAHGISNLRVIDASVIPVIPDCRIQNSSLHGGREGLLS
ncbi:hypothetical protein N7481_001360 [Penicillium waksmanii]|uniref:uncharacterized protein n=1 Tax=Penicillium waksmanii TaxID=69791 RepID=UPI002547BA3D|nr:uncharacterized protein N7481_001360 [Penicillium waksmanii]KAJ6000951.1 hypothetical protein N7481_001360 [Penicillium waksmanii]